jgi:hypothetical protein
MYETKDDICSLLVFTIFHFVCHTRLRSDYRNGSEIQTGRTTNYSTTTVTTHFAVTKNSFPNVLTCCQFPAKLFCQLTRIAAGKILLLQIVGCYLLQKRDSLCTFYLLIFIQLNFETPRRAD